MLLLAAWRPGTSSGLLAYLAQTAKQGEGFLEMVMHMKEASGKRRTLGGGEETTIITEYMGRKKVKPYWILNYPETRVQNHSAAYNFEGLIQLNKCWIFPMFAQFLGDNI